MYMNRNMRISGRCIRRESTEDGYKGYLAIEHFDAPDQTAFLEQSASFLREFL